MADNKEKRVPKTQHKRKDGQGNKIENAFIVLDSPDDRITKQNGKGVTMVTNDSPDDVESE